MTIIDMARQAGFITDFGCRETASDELLTRFAALVRAQTLEEAAGVCENTLAQHYMKQVTLTHDQALLLAACADCAAAIRQLKDKT